MHFYWTTFWAVVWCTAVMIFLLFVLEEMSSITVSVLAILLFLWATACAPAFYVIMCNGG